jgi:hypothetical protein
LRVACALNFAARFTHNSGVSRRENANVHLDWETVFARSETTTCPP